MIQEHAPGNSINREVRGMFYTFEDRFLTRQIYHE